MSADNSASYASDLAFLLGRLSTLVESYLEPAEEAFFEDAYATDARLVEHYREIWEWESSPILPVGEHGREPFVPSLPPNAANPNPNADPPNPNAAVPIPNAANPNSNADPRTREPAPSDSDAFALKAELRRATDYLADLKHRLSFADHLSDRVLYVYVAKSILKTKIKRLTRPTPIVWDFRHVLPNGRLIDDPDRVYLTFYADDRERARWAEETGGRLPAKQTPRYPRSYPPFDREGWKAD